MSSIEEFVRSAQALSREGKTEIRQGLVALLWKQSATDLEKLSVHFAERKMFSLRDACRVIASIKEQSLPTQKAEKQAR